MEINTFSFDFFFLFLLELYEQITNLGVNQLCMLLLPKRKLASLMALLKNRLKMQIQPNLNTEISSTV